MENYKNDMNLKYVNPTNDLAFKKVLASNEKIHILAGFIKDFYFIEPEGLTIENPYSIKAYKEQIKDEEVFRMRTTISDIAAVMSFADYRSELQLRKENFFSERSLYYPLDKFVSRYKIVQSEKSAYARLRPVYSMNILGYNHFTEDENALRIFQLYDPVRNKNFSKNLLNLGYFELLKPNVETENQQQWQNYFLQKPLSSTAPEYIKEALWIIEMANMDEEEIKMITDAEYYKSIYDNQMDYATEEGLKRGMEKGVEKGLKEATLIIARKLLQRNRPIDEIIEDTGLTHQEIESLKNII